MDRIFYINLERRPDRRGHIERQLAAAGLADRAERVPAVDGRALDLAALPAGTVNRRGLRDLMYPGEPNGLSLTRGALGLALTYRALWERIARGTGGQHLVLEDDAALCEGFAGRLEELVAGLPPRWDLVYLGYSAGAAATFEPRGDRAAVPRGQINCTHAYLVTASGANKLLDRCFPLGHQIDTEMYLNFPHLEVYCAVPQLATGLESSGSDIQG